MVWVRRKRVRPASPPRGSVPGSRVTAVRRGRPLRAGVLPFARHPHIPTESGGTIWWACVVYACMSDYEVDCEKCGVVEFDVLAESTFANPTAAMWYAGFHVGKEHPGSDHQLTEVVEVGSE